MTDNGEPRAAEYHVRIRDLPPDERPRERLLKAGAKALSTSELLAILIRTGTREESALAIAARLISSRGLDGIQRASAAELAAEHGLGEAKAAQLKAALELGARLRALRPEERPTIGSPEDVLDLVGAEMSLLEQEELRVLLLTTKHQVVGTHTIYRGNVRTAAVRNAEILREAVRRNCPAILVVHNHPSGDPAPSDDDVAMTRALAAAGSLLDIDLIDHIIVGTGRRHTSLRAQGFLTPPG